MDRPRPCPPARSGLRRFEDWRDGVLEARGNRAPQARPQDRARRTSGCTAASPAAASATCAVSRELADHAQGAARAAQRPGQRAPGGGRGRAIEQAHRRGHGISKSFGGAPIVEDFSTRIMRGDRVGIVGPNGAGKTTLLKLLTGALAPDSGNIRLGENWNWSRLDQRRDELNPEWTVADALTGGRGDQVVINGSARHVASYMKDFLFLPEQARRRCACCRVASGPADAGARARQALERAGARRADQRSRSGNAGSAAGDARRLSGTVMLVSHDRDFLDRVVTSVIAAEGEGRWTEYAGGYSDMLAQRKGEDLEKARRVSDTPGQTSMKTHGSHPS